MNNESVTEREARWATELQNKAREALASTTALIAIGEQDGCVFDSLESALGVARDLNKTVGSIRYEWDVFGHGDRDC